jgi:hypothetical protein
MYGAVPGGIGNGAFGCNPGGFNNMGMPTTALGNGWGGLFGNGAPGTLPYGTGINGAPPFIGGQGPWGSAALPQTGLGYGTGLPAVLPYQANSPAYNPYLLNSELNLLNNRAQAPAVLPYLGNSGISPIQTYPAGSALSAPVLIPSTGTNTGYYNPTAPATLGTGVMYGR